MLCQYNRYYYIITKSTFENLRQLSMARFDHNLTFIYVEGTWIFALRSVQRNLSPAANRLSCSCVYAEQVADGIDGHGSLRASTT